MGVILAMIYRRRWLSLAGIASILIGGLLPWPTYAVNGGFIALGGFLIAVQIPIAIRDERRKARLGGPGDSN
jgi:hypothetical protein